MKELLAKWIELKNKENDIREDREQVEVELYLKLKDSMDGDSQATWNYDDYKLTIKPNYSVSVNQEMASNNPELFKVKYEMSYSQYKKSEVNVDEMVTIKQTKPTFKVELK